MKLLPEIARVRPDLVAIDDGTETRTFSELVDAVTRLGRLFREGFGLEADGHVAMLVGNRVEFVELALAALWAGVWITPVNWHLQTSEVAGILRSSGARVVIADDDHLAQATAAIDLAGGGAGDVVALSTLGALTQDGSDEPFSIDGPPGGSMFFTSGTSGEPKGVRRMRPATLGAQLSALADAGRVLGLDGSGPHLVTGPLYHAAPVGFAIMDLLQGGRMVIMPRWDAAATLELIAHHDVRDTHLVPTMFSRLLRLPDEVRDGADVSSLRTVLHGAAPIDVHTKQAMIDWWGRCLVEYWGASEGGVVTLASTDDWLSHPGTVGRPVPAYEVFAGMPDGQALPVGTEGTLWCVHRRLARVFEYHDDPEKTATAHPEDGRYSIGDIGRVDEDGFVYLSDRASNMIISGGVNIYPAEIEKVLSAHPDVADVAVFGIPDDEWGEQVKAVVELTGEAVASDEVADRLRAFARERLASFKVPRSIDFVDALPRQITGKLATRVLRDPYWEGRDRQI